MSIPQPSDIPDLDTDLGMSSISVLLKALDPAIPWTNQDQKHGRKVGTYPSHQAYPSGSSTGPNLEVAYRKLLEPLGWIVSMETNDFGGTMGVMVRKP